MQYVRSNRSTARQFVAATLLITLTALGCAQNEYEIDMTVDGQTVQRSLTASAGAADGDKARSLSTEEEVHLAEVYGSPVNHDDKGRTILQGEFVGRLPNDVGGHGEITRWDTSLGSLSVYLERFRGDDDLQGQLTQRLATIDAAVDLLHAWVNMAAVDTPDGQRLREFVDTDLRRDVKNVWLICWSSTCNNPRELAVEQQDLLMARLTQYAVEHDYISLEHLPAWEQDDLDQGGQELHLLLLPLRQRFEQRLGIDDICSILPSLASEQTLQQSLDNDFRRTDAWQTFLQLHPSTDRPDPLPSQKLIELLQHTFLASFQPFDQVHARLKLTTQPFATNGDWNNEDGTVTWDAHIAPRDEPPLDPLSTLHYAAWSEPNKAFQQEHFGRVLLTGRPLAEYVLWHQTTTGPAGEAWDHFLTTLTPNDNLRQRLDEFQASIATTPPGESGWSILRATLPSE